MSASTSPAASREAARHDDGRFGTQHRAEADVDLGLDDPAVPGHPEAPERFTLDYIDSLVGSFPGVGACVENPPSDDAVGYRERVSLDDVGFWGASAQTFATHFGCDLCRSQASAAGGAVPGPPVCTDGGEPCEYRYVTEMARDMSAGSPMDPIVAYHRPPGHPLRTDQSSGQRDYEIDDGHHRISAALIAKQADLDALVFHEDGCCGAAST